MKVTLQGNPFNTVGEMPRVGEKAPDFGAARADLSNLHLSELLGKRVVLNIFPSVDTGVCAASVRKFNKVASELSNTVVLCVSKDHPGHCRPNRTCKKIPATRSVLRGLFYGFRPMPCSF